MSAATLLSGVVFRRRRRELALLGVLVAVTIGAVTSAAVASTRAGSSIDRLLEYARIPQVSVSADPETIDELVETLRSQPRVDGVSIVSTATVGVGETADFDTQSIHIEVTDPLAAESSADISGVDLDRPIVVDGRRPRPDRAEEVMLHEWKAELNGWDIGERLPATLLTRDDISPEPGEEFTLTGPTLDLHVVGIARTGRDVARVLERDSVGAYGSAALAKAHQGGDVVWWPPSVVAHVDGGDEDVAAVWEVAVAALDIDRSMFFDGVFVGGVADVLGAAVDSARSSADATAIGLAAFAVVAAVAGGIAVTQSIARLLAGVDETSAIARQLGASRTTTALGSTIPPVAAATAGVLVGAALAIGASAHLPRGLARRAEVDPGIWIRPDIVLAIAVTGLASITAGTFLAARRRTTTSRRASARGIGHRHRRPFTPTAATALGVRHAFDRTTRLRALAARAAVAAVITGVAGSTAAVYLASNADALRDDPARWGWTWSSAPEHYRPDRTDDVMDALAEDPRIAAVGSISANGVLVDGTHRSAFAVEPRHGELRLAVRSGRLPESATEVALGSRTLRSLAVDIGDAVAVAAADGTGEQTLTVVGTAVVPYDSAGTIDDGIVLTPPSLAQITAPGSAAQSLHLTYADGVDADQLEEELGNHHDLLFSPFSAPNTPGTVANVATTRQIAVAVGLFLGALGIVALTHALSSTARHRARDVAVLRALGLRPAQVRRAFLAQATVSVALGIVVGLPLGVGVGRLVWHSTTDDLGALTNPILPVTALALVAAGALAAAAVVAVPAGATTAARSPASDLRTE